MYHSRTFAASAVGEQLVTRRAETLEAAHGVPTLVLAGPPDLALIYIWWGASGETQKALRPRPSPRPLPVVIISYRRRCRPWWCSPLGSSAWWCGTPREAATGWASPERTPTVGGVWPSLWCRCWRPRLSPARRRSARPRAARSRAGTRTWRCQGRSGTGRRTGSATADTRRRLRGRRKTLESVVAQWAPTASGLRWQDECSEMTYPGTEGPLPENGNPWDTRSCSLPPCSDRPECSGTCDFHHGTRQYLENMHLITH